MKRYLYHIAHSWKALVLIAGVFQLFTIFYVVSSLINGSFVPEIFLKIIFFASGIGAIISLVNAWSEIAQQDRIKSIFNKIEWRKVAGTLKLIDEYKNGWGRSIMITGTFQNKKVQIKHKYEKIKGRNDKQLYMLVLVEIEREFYEEAASLKFGDHTNALAINTVLTNAIAASKDPKFGEVYWELKRRRGVK